MKGRRRRVSVREDMMTKAEVGVMRLLAQVKELRQPLESGKGEETDSLRVSRINTALPTP